MALARFWAEVATHGYRPADAGVAGFLLGEWKKNDRLMSTRKNNEEGGQVARALLEGTGLAGFTFSTQFSLRFTRAEAGSYAGELLPGEVELVLHGTWWLGGETQWRERVSNLAPAGAIEPDEPVQAFELTGLRWMEGTVIESAVVNQGKLTLQFQNGQVLTASTEMDEGGAAWTLGVAGEVESDAAWSVVSEGRELFVRGPHLRPEAPAGE